MLLCAQRVAPGSCRQNVEVFFVKTNGELDINELLRGKPRSIRSFGTTSIVLGEVVYIHLLFPAPEYMF